jgi:cytosine/adenosine deaminase-related metal-dependent hydrolase
MFLFGRTAGIRTLLDLNGAAPHLALGTDSRLTGSRDLLDEMRCARSVADVTADELFDLVTTRAAALLRHARGGRIAVGAPADLVVVPAVTGGPGDALLSASRRDVRLVAIGGRPLVADPVFAPVFDARRVAARPLRIDDAPKLAESGLVRRIAGCPIAEAGVAAA